MDDKYIQRYINAAPGQWFECENKEIWLKPEQSVWHHTEGALINLLTGKMQHITYFKTLEFTNHNHVMW